MKLLKAELDNWKPSAAIFLTEVNTKDRNFNRVEADAWFGRFQRALTIEPLRPSGEFVHVGSMKMADHRVRVVVTLRPENLSPQKLSNQILTAINQSVG